MPAHPWLLELGRRPKVLLLGSGGLSIGQAGEFDYSGTQALKSFHEESIDVVIVNPNIATVQTNQRPHTKVYLYPVEPEWVEKVIQAEKPDAVVAGFGGQTALNCAIKMEEQGMFSRYNLRNLGTDLGSLRITEDRDLFAKAMREIEIPVPPSAVVTEVDQALDAGRAIGFPVICRAAFALGGLGSGFAEDETQLRRLVESALASSPQVLIEKSLRGWKEIEYEIMRDTAGNTIAICNMENFDPMGIHTGDSIVVAPSQTLDDEEYQRLRNAAFRIAEHLEILGECNVQYALSPDSSEFFVIEVNARLSRSSALASKATGYPIAAIAAKVVLGHTLLELTNPVTGVTKAFYEPALDYIAVKIPRWDLVKFRGADRTIGSAMKSVGEVMAIGRSFPETLQKAFRMVTERPEGLSLPQKFKERGELFASLKIATDNRLLELMQAFRAGYPREEIFELTRIDKWFLASLEKIVAIERDLQALRVTGDLALDFVGVTPDQWRCWKSAGFSDEQIAGIYLRTGPDMPTETEIREASLILRRRRKALGVAPVVKKIDTTAAEYPSTSNYLYLTYGGQFNDLVASDGKSETALVLGSGTYRIGTSVEFDWCAVECSQRLRAEGWRSVVLNCNPETVSTDHNSSDRLYFDEVSFERVLDVADLETPTGVVVSMGGQLPNRLAASLTAAGIRILGHDSETIRRAEDRQIFSDILDKAEVRQPRWISAAQLNDIKPFIDKAGFPVIVRPSFVLSGAAMNVVYDWPSLERALSLAADVSAEHPVVVSEFITDAIELELDGVAQSGRMIAAVVSEHIENAGIHSGDATLVLPPQKIDPATRVRILDAGERICAQLRLNGPFNIQFMHKAGELLVIECNARASRSFPFVSKVTQIPLAQYATDVLIGRSPAVPPTKSERIGVKAAMFSFNRLAGADPVLGVEMTSTGEVGCVGADLDEALLLALQATGIRRPKVGVLVSSGTAEEKRKFLSVMEILRKLDVKIYATPGTARHLKGEGYEVMSVPWPGEGRPGEIDAGQIIQKKQVDLVINVPKNFDPSEIRRDVLVRRTAVQFGCALITDIEKATAFLRALHRHPRPQIDFRVTPLS
ncbi:MAG: carbamoyl-phosphate synthase (glutamine-hydrolyzing) large subunit [Bacteriovoracia bacterium]